MHTYIRAWRGVGEAGVEIAVCFEVEETAHVFAGCVFEGGGLHNRDLARLAETAAPTGAAFVGVNPVSTLTTAVRSLFGGDPDGGAIALVIGEGAVLTAVFATLTTRLYRR